MCWVVLCVVWRFLLATLLHYCFVWCCMLCGAVSCAMLCVVLGGVFSLQRYYVVVLCGAVSCMMLCVVLGGVFYLQCYDGCCVVFNGGLCCELHGVVSCVVFCGFSRCCI